MTRHERLGAEARHLVEALVVEMRNVEHHADALHLGKRLAPRRRQTRMAVVAARERALGVPRKRCHMHAHALEHLHQGKILGKQARVLDGMHRHGAPRLERGTDGGDAMCLGHAIVVEISLPADVRHDLGLKAHGLRGRELVGDERGKALRPRRIADLLERDGGAVVGQVDALVRALLVALAVKILPAGAAQGKVERLPTKTIGGIAMQVKYRYRHRFSRL